MKDLTFNKLKLQVGFIDDFDIELITPISNEKRVEEISPTGSKRKKVYYSGSDFEIFYIEYVNSNYPLLADLDGELYSILLIGAKNVNKTRDLEIDGIAEAVDIFKRIFPNRSSPNIDVFIEKSFVAVKYENQSFVLVYKGATKNSLVVGELKLKG
ncbi:hypothetical protein [Aliiglaciecola lipolytica]|uniref:hypothetical protein n=1 Tax=Aliiglaciecola lipolytica TaxID=477689 RepID=UPI001C0833BD|nr:hypothetical protein [Aliiglaciecola lipolytica]MBU2879622.1 hypothetical protein [Aliiglaciecola lipolytica]